MTIYNKLLVAVGSICCFSVPAMAAESISSGGPQSQLETEKQANGAVNPHYGTYRRKLDLDLPRGLGGNSPDISVVVDPGMVDGLIESGWGVSGFGSVSRRSETGGVPSEITSSSDLYQVDGQDLYEQNNSWETWFEPEYWDGSALFYDQETNLWERRRDGWVWHYGGLGASATVVIDQAEGNVLQNTAEWLLTSVVDPFGNVVEFEYQEPTVVIPVAAFSDYGSVSGEHLPTLIRYNGGDVLVAFSYTLRSSSDVRGPWVSYRSGRQVLNQYRLSGIDSYVGSNHYSSYEVVHPSLDEVRLERKDTLGLLPNRPVLTAQYQPQGTEWWDLDDGSVSGLDYTVEIPDPWGTTTLDADGNVASVWRDTSEESLSAQAANINGDAFPDLVIFSTVCSPAEDSPVLSRAACSRNAHVMLNVPRGDAAPFSTGDTYIPGFDGTSQIALDYSAQLAGLDTQLIDLDGDGTLEVADRHGVWRYTVTGFVYELGWYSALAATPWRFADVDGDGMLDALIHDSSGTPQWSKNLGHFQFGPIETLDLPAAPGAGCSFTTGHGMTYAAPATLNTQVLSDYTESQMRLSDVNGDGIADVTYSLFGCVDDSNVAYTSPREGFDIPVSGTETSEIYWGNGRGGFVRSGLTAGLPFMEPVPFDTGEHAYDPDLWTSQDTFAVVDLDRSLVPEIAQVGDYYGNRDVRVARFIDLAQGFNFQDLAGNPAGAVQEDAFGGPVYPRGYAADDSIGSYSGYDATTYVAHTQALGATEPYFRASVLADFDGNGFDDVIDFQPNFGDRGVHSLMEWKVLYSRNARTQPARQIVALSTEAGGVVDLTWGYSATLGDNPDLHYNRQVVASTKRSGEQPTLYRYFKGEHAAERFRGFGTVETTNSGGATTEYGFGTAPHVEGFPTHVVAYRRDGTIERATFNLFFDMDSSGWFWDISAPFFNPVSRRCDYALGHGTGAGASRSQSLGVDDLWLMCVDSVSLSKDEYTAGVGWHPNPDLSDPSSSIADEVWGRSDDDDTSGGTGGGGLGSTGLYPSGTSDSIPGPDIGIEDAFTLAPPVVAVGGPGSFGSTGFLGVYSPSHPSNPDGGSSTEVWETTTNYFYEKDADSDGIDDHLLVTIEQEGVTDAPSASWTLSDDDLRVERAYEVARDMSAWGFRLETVATRSGTGSILQLFERRDFKAFDVPAEVLEFGDDPFLPPRVTTRDYLSGGLTGEVYGVQYPDGASESWVRGAASGACANSGAPTQHVDPVSRAKDVVLDALCRDSSFSYEGLSKTTTYDGFNRVSTQATAVENIDGTVSIAQVTYQYTPTEVVEYEREGSSLTLRRRSEFRMDSYGREVASTRCEASVVGVECAAMPPGTPALGSQKVYGSDGRVLVEYGPYDLETSEAMVQYSLWSGQGSLLELRSSPNVEAPTGGFLSLQTTSYEHWPVSTVRVRPDGVVEQHYRDPMESWSLVGSFDRGSTEFDALGRTVRTIDGEGKQQDLTYTRFGELETVSSPSTAPCMSAGTSTYCSNDLVYGYDAMSRRVAVDPPGPGWSETHYDSAGRPTLREFHGTAGSVVLESLSYSNYTSGSLSNVVAVNEHGATTTVWVDGAGREQQTQDTLGTSVNFFGGSVLPQKTQDVDSLVRSYSYDGLDRLEAVSRDSDGVVESQFGYSPFGIEYVVDGDGVEVFQDFAVSGLPTRSYAARSMPNEFTLFDEVSYGAMGWVEERTSGGVLTEYYYDDVGRVVEAVVGGGLKTEVLTWRADDLLETSTLSPVAGGAATTTRVYDSWGRMEELVNPDGTSSLQRYDEFGHLTQLEDERGALSTWLYDERGRLESSKGPSSGWTQFSYASSAGSSQVWSQDASGGLSIAVIDGGGRTTSVEYPDGTTMESSYSGSLLTEVVHLDPSGAAMARKGYSYWTHDNQIQAEWGWHSGGTSTSPSPSDYLVLAEWTDGGRQSSIGTPTESTVFGYESDGQLAWEEWQAGFQRREIFRDEVAYVDGSETFYKPWVNAETLVGGIGSPGGSGSVFRDVSLVRDAAGRLTERWTDDGTQDQTEEFLTYDAYDQPGVVRSLQGTNETVKHDWLFDARGRPESRSTTLHGSTILNTDFGWYDNGALEFYTTPSGAQVAYDRPNPLTHGGEDLLAGVDVGVVGGSMSTAISIGSRDLNNRATSFVLPNSTLSMGYDLMGRVTSQSISGTAGTSSWTRGFDDRGRIEVETISTPASSWSNHYIYDEPGWLVEEYRGKTGDTYEYSYDADGRRQDVLVNGGSPQDVLTWDSGQVTQVDTSTVVFDDWGGVLQDHLGHQIERTASGHASAVLDSTGGALYDFTRDASGLVVENMEASSGTRLNTWGLGLGGLPLEVEDAAGAVTVPIQIEGMLLASFDGSNLTDLVALPSLSLAFDGMGDVDPGTAFGDGAGVSASGFRFSFGGNEMLPDAPGIQLAQQRLYDESTGRFLSSDPIGLAGGLHRSRYVGGNPVSYSDPSGLFYDPNPDSGSVSSLNDVYKLWGTGSESKGGGFRDRVGAAWAGFLSKRSPGIQQLFGPPTDFDGDGSAPDHNEADEMSYAQYARARNSDLQTYGYTRLGAGLEIALELSQDFRGLAGLGRNGPATFTKGLGHLQSTSDVFADSVREVQVRNPFARSGGASSLLGRLLNDDYGQRTGRRDGLQDLHGLGVLAAEKAAALAAIVTVGAGITGVGAVAEEVLVTGGVAAATGKVVGTGGVANGVGDVVGGAADLDASVVETVIGPNQLSDLEREFADGVRQATGTTGNTDVTYGANEKVKLRKHSQHMRETARPFGVEIPKSPSKDATQAAMRDWIETVVAEGDHRQGQYMTFDDALWSRYGDGVVVRLENGEFLTYLDYRKGGVANGWDSAD